MSEDTPIASTSQSRLVRNTSLHATTPALLRAAISSVSLRDEATSSQSDPTKTTTTQGEEERKNWRGNVVVSHPPSPTSVLSSFESFTDDVESLQSSYRPFDSITPLNPNSLRRIPLSTPPRSPPPGLVHDGETGHEKEGSMGNGNFGAARRRRSSANEVKEDYESGYKLILVTGGSGFIGSHTVLEILQEANYGVIVIDNLANSSTEVLQRVRLLASKYHKERGLPRERHPPLYFHSCDIQDRHALSEVFELYSLSSSPNPNPKRSRIISAIHFAALKSVSGSLSLPINYYQVNVGGTLNLVQTLAEWNVKRLVFSSSCVVYGSEADGEGITEDLCDVVAGASKGITNPYGRTKRMCEEILADVVASDQEWRCMSLRYTNPSGAHPSGYIGEDPTNAANLMPIVTQVLQGKRDHVKIYGADYSTPDGTGVRDFIHVVDLAKAHLAALRAIIEPTSSISRSSTYNLGTNKGTSVLRVIEMLSLIAQRSIEIVVCPRRPGDLGCVVCSAEKAEKDLGWKAELDIIAMCRDLVNWQFLNPNGYSSPSKSRLGDLIGEATFA